MSPSHIPWSSIELLHHVVRTLNYLHNDHQLPLPCLDYRAKIKLHGSNCAVQIHPDGTVLAQSRTQLLTPKADYKGFAAWVESQSAYFSALRAEVPWVVFGEWCGPGVEKGMAVSELPQKIFAVFALQMDMGAAASLWVEPAEIQARLGILPQNMHVLPWENHGMLQIDYASEGSIEQAAALLNQQILEVEAEDPWIKRVFAISGLGEGLVMYPILGKGLHPELWARQMFKVKGDKHRVAGKVAAQRLPTVSESPDAFVGQLLTEARLEQGLSVVCAGLRDPRLTGKFLAWVLADVQKESKAELEVSGLHWAQVLPALQSHARHWYLQRA